jgi:hypothetical protein
MLYPGAASGEKFLVICRPTSGSEAHQGCKQTGFCQDEAVFQTKTLSRSRTVDKAAKGDVNFSSLR